MNIEVTKDNVVIIENSDTPHENEYKITTCYFTFDSFTSAFEVKYAVFTILSTGESYQVDIVNNQCDIPSEVLKQEYETVKLGVYGENIDTSGEEEVLEKRFSPSYTTFVVPTGSYEENAETPEIITPSQYEIYSQALQEGLDEVESALQEVENVDIDASKVDNKATITITNRNGESKSVDIYDGTDGVDGVGLNYDWDDTKLGIKREDEQEYEYVELKGKDGDDYVITQADYENIATIVRSEITIPTKTSDLTNDSGFIDNSVNNLTNYYDKTNVYTKTEIDTKISSVYKYKGSVATYQDLPSTDLTVGDVYNVESDGSNYAWNGTAWDKLGGEVDLSNYYNKTQTDTLLSGKVDTSTLNDYYTKTRADELLATKVGFTDYATNNVGGVVKVSNTYGGYVDNNGNIQAYHDSYSSYSNRGNNFFIGKGTLENVITGKDLTTKAYVDGLVGDIATTLDTIQREVI